MIRHQTALLLVSAILLAGSPGCGGDDSSGPRAAAGEGGQRATGGSGGSSNDAGGTGAAPPDETAGSPADSGAGPDNGAGAGGEDAGPEDFPNPVQASEGDTTLLGTDGDGDGVRDDLGTLIQSIESDPSRQTALLSFARESTAMMLIGGRDDGTRAEASDEVQRVAATLGCLYALYVPNYADASPLLEQIRNALYNNAARLRAYNHASTLLSGTVLHNVRGCDASVTGVTL